MPIQQGVISIGGTILRAQEIRLAVTHVGAVGIIVTATCWAALAKEPVTSWSIARGVGVVIGSILAASLTFWVLQREWRNFHQGSLQHARKCLLSEIEPASELVDPDTLPLVAEIRSQVTDLRSRLDASQLKNKMLEIQLRLSDAERRQTQSILNGISDAVIVTNTFDEILLANPAAARILGFDSETCARKPFSELVSFSPLVQDISEARQAHSRSTRGTGEYTIERDGVKHSYRVSMNAVTDSSGQFSAMVTVLHDVTRDKEVSAMKSEFVSHVSHELRTPLASIRAYAELLVDGEATDEASRQEFYRVIQSEADRLSRMIENILNVSRIEAGITKTNRTQVSLTGILKQVLEVAQPGANEKKIMLVDELSPVFFQIEADRDMIYQAAMNLVSNAIKYTPQGGTVRLETTVDEDKSEVSVLVHDTGVGIPEDAMKNLFQKFYRVEQNKSVAKGSGLGLHLTRKIIENVHKGRMVVSSQVGKGSTFGFTLPIIK